MILFFFVTKFYYEKEVTWLLTWKKLPLDACMFTLVTSDHDHNF